MINKTKSRNFLGFVGTRSCRAFFYHEPEHIYLNIRVLMFESNGNVWLKLTGLDDKKPREKFIADDDESYKFISGTYGLREALFQFNMIETKRTNNNQFL